MAGKTIKQLREEQGWTQAELGKRVGVSAGVVSAWENAKTAVPILKRLALTQVFNVGPDEIRFPLTGRALEQWTKVLTGKPAPKRQSKAEREAEKARQWIDDHPEEMEALRQRIPAFRTTGE